MITHRKISQLRLQRSAYPQDPFWQAVTIAPYGTGRGFPVQINYVTLTADAKPRVDVSVTRAVTDQLERERFIESPALVDASDVSELVYRRGEGALAFLTDAGVDTICLVSANGAVPIEASERSLVAVSCWPLHLQDIERMFEKCRARGHRWGAVVPLLHPITTKRKVLEELAELARRNGARFFAAIPVETEAAARHVLASMEQLDDSEVAELFDADLGSIVVAAERFAAGIATAHGMLDHVPCLAPLTSNWTAAMKLSLAGTRMIRMGEEMELGWTLHQSSKLIAKLHKPLDRIAESASLAIIDALDLTSVAALEQWLRDGRSDFFEKVDGLWREGASSSR